jgi:hypothetical protein
VATGSLFTWNYDVQLQGGQTVGPGDFFTIYDFGNFVSGSNMQPPNWTPSSSPVGITPPGVTPTDNPSVANLTWTYDGVFSIVGPSALGEFSVLADTDKTTASDFAAQATNSSSGSKVPNVGAVFVPVPEPELSALLLYSAVLAIGVATLLRRRKRG